MAQMSLPRDATGCGRNNDPPKLIFPQEATMHLVDQIKAKARADQRRVVLPESYDDRMIEAAARIAADGLAHVILLGNDQALHDKGKQLNADLDGVTLIEPCSSELLSTYADELVALRRKKGLTRDQALALLTAEDNLYFAAMMVRLGEAGGAVAGAANTTGDVLRAAFQVVGTAANMNTVS